MNLSLLTQVEQGWTAAVFIGIVVTIYALYQAFLDYIDVRNDNEFSREQIAAKGAVRRESLRLFIQLSLFIACIVSLHLLSRFKIQQDGHPISIHGEQLIPTICFSLAELGIVVNTFCDLLTRHQGFSAYRKLKRRDATPLASEYDWTEDEQ